MRPSEQTSLSLFLLGAVCATAAGLALLGRTTSVIPDNVAREETLHRESNGVHFYDGGYIDDGDFVLLGEMPKDDYSRGGVYFVGSSEMRTSIMPWTLPEPERRLIHNYALGDLRHHEVRAYLDMLIDERGLLEAGPEKTTIVLSLYFMIARQKDLADPIDRYVKDLFERHHLYTYDREDGIHVSSASAVERFLRVERDWANRFLRVLLTRPSRVRTIELSIDWRRQHMVDVMGEDWRAVMQAEIDELERTLDLLQARGVRVVALFPPTGTWQDDVPYDRTYQELVKPLLVARGIPLEDFSDFLSDDELGDDVHANYKGQQRLHEAYRRLALRQLEAMGTALEPAETVVAGRAAP